jgi:aspartate/methionine/tyrosine aminotransferase
MENSQSNEIDTNTKNTTDNTELKQSYEPNLTLWEDLVPENIKNILFSPWGLSTENVPKFHLDNIKEVADTAKAIDYQYYNMTRGMDQLLNSISENFSHIFYGEAKSETSRKVPIDQIFVTAGGLGVTKALLNTLIKNKDDEIVTFDPYYPYYYGFQKLYNTQGKFVTVPLEYNEKTKIISYNFQKLEQTLTEKTKLLILINPHNPNCNVFTVEEYLKITEIIDKFPNLMVLEDAAYFPYLLGGKKVVHFANVSPKNANRTLTAFSGGKVFNVTGLRVGWCIGNEKLIKELGYVTMLDISHTPSFEQMVIAKDLKSAEEEKFFDQVAKNSEKNFEIFDSFMKKYKMTVLKPEGTYYCLVDVSCYRDQIPMKYYYRPNGEYCQYLDQAFSRILLEKNIGFMPMTPTQNSPQKVDCLVRVSLNRKEEDLRLVENVLEQLQKEFGFL